MSSVPQRRNTKPAYKQTREENLKRKFERASKALRRRIGKNLRGRERKAVEIEVCFIQKRIQDYGFRSSTPVTPLIRELDSLVR